MSNLPESSYVYVVTETKIDPSGNTVWVKPWLAFESERVAKATATEENAHENKRQAERFYVTDGVFSYAVHKVLLDKESDNE